MARSRRSHVASSAAFALILLVACSACGKSDDQAMLGKDLPGFGPALPLGEAPHTGEVGAELRNVRLVDVRYAPESPRTSRTALFDLVVTNGTSEAIHVLRRWHHRRFDPVAGRLTLEQRHRQWVNDNSSANCHALDVSAVTVRAHERVALPEDVTLEYDTFVMVGETPIPSRHIHVREEVRELTVEMVWSDQPFDVRGEGCRAALTARLISLERGTTVATAAIPGEGSSGARK